MKNVKKALCLGLMVVVAATAFAGCTPFTKKINASGQDANQATQKQKEKPVLKYLGRDATFDLGKNPMIPILEKATGYKVEYEALPLGEEGATKLMLLITSGTPYDIINVYPAFFDRVLAVNAVKPLEDMLKKAPDIMKAVPKDSESWRRVKAKDGKVHGIPQLLPVVNAVTTIAVRQDIFDSLGIKMPATPDEFYNALREIKSKKPDMIPFVTDKKFAPSSIAGTPYGFAAPIMSGFDVYKDWYEVNGKLVPNNLRPEYKEYIAFMRKLYAEGLMDKEFPANDDAQKLGKFTSGKAATVYFHYSQGPGFYSALEKAVPGAKVSYLPFLKDKNGKKGTMGSYGLEKVTFIPKTASHPEDAIAWVDAFMANFKDIYIGQEGVDHKVENGKYIPIMPNFSVHDTVWWFMPALDEKDGPEWWKARVRKSAEVERGYMDTFDLRTSDVNIAPPFFAMYPPNEEFTKLNAALGQYWSDEMVKIIVGATPMENYEKAVAKWEADGGTRLVQLANDMWKENKK